MSKTKKVSVRLQEGEGFITLSEMDFNNLAVLFDTLAENETRFPEYKEGWVAAAVRFREAKATVFSPTEEEDTREWL